MFRKTWKRALAVSATALALVAGQGFAAAADPVDDIVEVGMVWDGTNDAVRDVGINIFGSDNVVVPGDSGERTLRITNFNNPSDGFIIVSLIDVLLDNPDADDVYEFLNINGYSAAEIKAAEAAGTPLVVFTDSLELDAETLIDFNWEMPVVERVGGSPGNVAQVGAAREVNFVVRIIITGEVPGEVPTPPTPPIIPPPPIVPPPPAPLRSSARSTRGCRLGTRCACRPRTPQVPPAVPPTQRPPGGILAETGGALAQQPLWIWGAAAVAVAAVIGFARKREAA